jgi:hypothetical protein
MEVESQDLDLNLLETQIGMEVDTEMEEGMEMDKPLTPQQAAALKKIKVQGPCRETITGKGTCQPANQCKFFGGRVNVFLKNPCPHALGYQCCEPAAVKCGLMGAFKCADKNTCLFFGGQGTPDLGHNCKGKENYCCNPTSPNPYQNAPRRGIAGNGGAVYQTVAIRREHLSDPSIYGVDPGTKDNSMQVDTAIAFYKLHSAASKAGHRITISSGFRTLARQNYFWNCYQTKRCNNGNLAARPGTSNHGVGKALDLSLSGAAYSWMRSNAQAHGFVRTVPTETWHWEYRPGSPRASYT